MTTREFARALVVALLSAVTLAGATAVRQPAMAQEAPAVEDSQRAKVQQLVKLLDDPDVRAWLSSAPQGSAPASPVSIASRLSDWDEALREHAAVMASAFRRLPTEVAGAIRNLAQESGGRGLGYAIAMLFGLLAAGYIAERLARRLVSGIARQTGDATTSTDDFGAEALLRVAPLLAFSAVSLGVFFAFRWPELSRKVVLTYLIALIVVRLVSALSALLTDRVLSTQQSSDTNAAVATLTPDSATFWHKRIVIFAAYLMAVWATLSLLPAVGFSADAVQLLTYLAGLGLLALAIEVVWHAPQAGSAPAAVRRWLHTVSLIALWCFWSMELHVVLWLGIYALVLPKALSATGQVAQSLAVRKSQSGAAVRNVLIVRGARAALILLAVLWLGFVLRVNPGTLATASTVGSQVMRGLLRSVVILVVADLLWQLVKTYIDRTIASDGSDPEAAAEAARRSRLHTLLPIFRNALAVLIVTVAGLMVLAELGVQIGPLIAGAGIFGVAIGFGSQTLVKDIVSGIFYLMDDAFRVGEYIQSGKYMGTVESFSLRSVRLRHHRGPVFTVPFGELGAVQNMSRDWAIEKFMIRVPFDTDTRLVKKLIKEVGAKLLEDPEIAPDILQTLKMKGVEQFGDYGMELSFAMMTKPGHQSSIRRRAYSMIRDVFAENGIDFALPTVQVGGEERAATAAGAASAVTVGRLAKPAAELSPEI